MCLVPTTSTSPFARQPARFRPLPEYQSPFRRVKWPLAHIRPGTNVLLGRRWLSIELRQLPVEATSFGRAYSGIVAARHDGISCSEQSSALCFCLVGSHFVGTGAVAEERGNSLFDGLMSGKAESRAGHHSCFLELGKNPYA